MTRPDLINAEEIIPPSHGGPCIGSSPEEDAAAQLMLRRLANRHDHARLPRRSGGWREVCPDPAAHARDAADLAAVLEACGFIPCKPARPVRPPDGCSTTVTSYRRP